MGALIKHDTDVTDDVLNAIAHIPTRSLASVVEKAFCRNSATAISCGSRFTSPRRASTKADALSAR